MGGSCKKGKNRDINNNNNNDDNNNHNKHFTQKRSFMNVRRYIKIDLRKNYSCHGPGNRHERTAVSCTESETTQNLRNEFSIST